jgi:hypothetical protein
LPTLPSCSVSSTIKISKYQGAASPPLCRSAALLLCCYTALLLRCSTALLLRCSAALVMPTEITYMDTEDEYKCMVLKIHIFKVHIFKLDILYLRITKIHIFEIHILYLEITKIHIFKSIFRFPISSLGSPNFSFSEKLRRSVG